MTQLRQREPGGGQEGGAQQVDAGERDGHDDDGVTLHALVEPPADHERQSADHGHQEGHQNVTRALQRVGVGVAVRGGAGHSSSSSSFSSSSDEDDARVDVLGVDGGVRDSGLNDRVPVGGRMVVAGVKGELGRVSHVESRMRSSRRRRSSRLQNSPASPVGRGPRRRGEVAVGYVVTPAPVSTGAVSGASRGFGPVPTTTATATAAATTITIQAQRVPLRQRLRPPGLRMGVSVSLSVGLSLSVAVAVGVAVGVAVPAVAVAVAVVEGGAGVDHVPVHDEADAHAHEEEGGDGQVEDDDEHDHARREGGVQRAERLVPEGLAGVLVQGGHEDGDGDEQHAQPRPPHQQRLSVRRDTRGYR